MYICKNARLNLLTFIAIILVFSGCEKLEHVDIVIIGGGLMGSAAAWQLSSNAQNVLLLEKQGPVYDQGSSYGEARIARSIGPKDDIWSFLHNRNVREAKELITFLNKVDHDVEHALDEIFTTSPVTYVRHIKQMNRIEKQLNGQQDSFLFASNPIKAKEIFDAVLSDTTIMLREYKPYSGTINPQALIKKMHTAVQKQGQEIRYKTKLLSLTKNDQHFELELFDLSSDNIYSIKANKVICAAGPYTGSVLREVAPYFDQLILSQRVFLSFLKIKRPIWDRLESAQKNKLSAGYPVINSSGGSRYLSFFSMIERWKGDEPIIKIGGHFQRSDIEDLDSIWHKPLYQEEIQWSIERTATYLAQLGLPIGPGDLELVDGYSCVYSLSKHEVPYVTPAVDPSGFPSENLVIMGAMSGVGAKGALAYGEIAAAYLLKQEFSGHMENKVLNAIGYEHLKLDLENLMKE